MELNNPRLEAEAFCWCRLQVDFLIRHSGENRNPEREGEGGSRPAPTNPNSFLPVVSSSNHVLRAARANLMNHDCEIGARGALYQSLRFQNRRFLAPSAPRTLSSEICVFFSFAALAFFARDNPISSFAPLALFAVDSPVPNLFLCDLCVLCGESFSSFVTRVLDAFLSRVI